MTHREQSVLGASNEIFKDNNEVSDDFRETLVNLSKVLASIERKLPASSRIDAIDSLVSAVYLLVKKEYESYLGTSVKNSEFQADALEYIRKATTSLALKDERDMTSN